MLPSFPQINLSVRTFGCLGFLAWRLMPRFLNFCSINILGCILFVVEVCPVHYKMFRSIAGFYLLELLAYPPLKLWQLKMSSDIDVCPLCYCSHPLLLLLKPLPLELRTTGFRSFFPTIVGVVILIWIKSGYSAAQPGPLPWGWSAGYLWHLPRWSLSDRTAEQVILLVASL